MIFLSKPIFYILIAKVTCALVLFLFVDYFSPYFLHSRIFVLLYFKIGFQKKIERILILDCLEIFLHI
jgi:hypothetical protein